MAAYAAAIPPIDGRVPLMERPRIVVLNKIDVPDARDMADFVKDELKSRGLAVFEVSVVSREGLRELGFALGTIVDHLRVQEAEDDDVRPVIRPLEKKDDSSFTITPRKQGRRFSTRFVVLNLNVGFVRLIFRTTKLWGIWLIV